MAPEEAFQEVLILPVPQVVSVVAEKPVGVFGVMTPTGLTTTVVVLIDEVPAALVQVKLYV